MITVRPSLSSHIRTGTHSDKRVNQICDLCMWYAVYMWKYIKNITFIIHVYKHKSLLLVQCLFCMCDSLVFLQLLCASRKNHWYNCTSVEQNFKCRWMKNHTSHDCSHFNRDLWITRCQIKIGWLKGRGGGVTMVMRKFGTSVSFLGFSTEKQHFAWKCMRTLSLIATCVW